MNLFKRRGMKYATTERTTPRRPDKTKEKCKLNGHLGVNKILEKMLSVKCTERHDQFHLRNSKKTKGRLRVDPLLSTGQPKSEQFH